VPLGVPLVSVVEDGGRVVSTRPVPPVEGRSVEQRVVLVRPDQETLRDLLARTGDGSLPTRVSEELPLADAPRAHTLAEAGGLRGKVVLRP
jgi:NADPH:quinone reductase